MASQIGGILIDQASRVLKDGSQTSEFKVAAGTIVAIAAGAWLKGDEIPTMAYLGASIVAAAYCLSRGQFKGAAAPAAVEAKAAAGTAPTLADRARTLPLAVVALLGVLFLAACQPADGPGQASPMRDPRAVIAQSCEAYASALMALAQMNNAGELSAETVQRVDAIRWQVGPVCESPPADPAPFVEAVSRSVSELVAIQLQEMSR